MKGYKKPPLKKFEEMAETCGGVVGRIAASFGVWRATVYRWCEADPAFQAVIDEYRGKLLDECLRSARAVSVGIPKLNDKNQIVGWIERPDGYMLRYLISTLGKREGFGEAIDVTSKGESVKPDPVVIEVIDSRERVERPDSEE